MQALANISQFETLQNSANVGQSHLGIFNPVENAPPGVGDRYNRPDIPPVDPVNPVPSKLPPPDPQWRKTVDERLQKIENTMATKADLKAMGDELKQLITSR